MKSKHPEAAIDMHTDVMEWEQALSLAEKLAPARVGTIAREYAIQLEQRCEDLNFNSFKDYYYFFD